MEMSMRSQEDNKKLRGPLWGQMLWETQRKNVPQEGA